MELKILNDAFIQAGVLDDYTSVIWSKRYNAIGDCEVYIEANEKTLSLLRKGYYITRDDDDMICRIESLEIDTDVENGNFIIAVGYDCRKILNQRIVWNLTYFTGTAEDFIRKIINENVVSPASALRRVDNFRLAAAKGFSDSIQIQSTYDYLFDKIQELSTTFGYGSKVTFNGQYLVFELYKGVDRSANQTTNDVVIFSPEFENLINTHYKSDSTNLKTAALIAGEGEGINRIRVEIIGDSRGILRNEIFVDAKDLSRELEDEQVIPLNEYKELLRQRGYEHLAEAVDIVTFDGEVEPFYSYRYGEDYFLGDIVTVRNEYGIEADARITEVIESDDENGYSIIPTFEYIVGSESTEGDFILTENDEVLLTEDDVEIEYE